MEVLKNKELVQSFHFQIKETWDREVVTCPMLLSEWRTGLRQESLSSLSVRHPLHPQAMSVCSTF